jgi:putative ABC transport system permease protein
MNLAGLARRNLARRSVRTCLSILGIGLAVGSALALMSLSHSIQDGMREGINEMGDDLVVMQKGASDIFGGFIPEQTIERIASIPGLTRASGELFMFAPSTDGSSVLAQGWPDTSYLWKKVPLREGRVPGSGRMALRCWATQQRPPLARSSATTSSSSATRSRSSALLTTVPPSIAG